MDGGDVRTARRLVSDRMRRGIAGAMTFLAGHMAFQEGAPWTAAGAGGGGKEGAPAPLIVEGALCLLPCACLAFVQPATSRKHPPSTYTHSHTDTLDAEDGKGVAKNTMRTMSKGMRLWQYGHHSWQRDGTVFITSWGHRMTSKIFAGVVAKGRNLRQAGLAVCALA